ncbi:MAG: fumarate hydratase, partial [Plesiomonas sp.]
MTIIRKDDLIDSVADALQYISYYHPLDFIRAMETAYNKEQNQAAKDAIAQILINSRMCAEGHRPICQDTGIVTCFVKIGMQVQWDTDDTVQEMVDEGVRRAYTFAENTLRASVVADPAGTRKNTKDNTPAVVHIEMVKGNTVEVSIAAKGGGSENKSKMVMLNPSDDIAEWVEKTLPTMGAGWCPPGMLGIGIGGTAEKAAVMAKEALMESCDIQELIERGAQTTEEKLRLDIYQRANRLGIGAQGLGGLTTVLDVKIKSAPTHAASKPVVMIPNCAATRHIHFTLDGSGAAELTPPSLDQWPKITWEAGANVRRVNLDTVTPAEIQQWTVGETVLLSGKMLTGRDAAHKRIHDMLSSGQGLPDGIDFNNRFIYY